MTRWYERWFNEYYLALYPERNEQEAEKQVDALFDLSFLPEGPLDVLDLGCGAGRHLVAFLRRGHRVVGVDQSSFLLQRAKERAPGATLLQRPFSHLGAIGPFDLVTSFFTSFGYEATTSEDRQVLEAVHRVLKSHGLFVLDYLHPDEIRRDLQPYSEVEVRGQLVRIEKRIEGDLVIKTIHFPKESYEERVRLYDRETLEALLRATGFDCVAVYGDFFGTPWSRTGQRQVFFARRRS